jgi:hypothetical protein
MRLYQIGAALLLACVCSCREAPEQPSRKGAAHPANDVAPAPRKDAVEPTNVVAPAPQVAPSEGAARPPREPLSEPKGPIDPKSGEAAGQVVQHYGALIEQHRFGEAAKLWGNATAAAEFARQLNHPEVHMEIGNLGESEGAAGSIYITVPVVFYGDTYRRPAEVTLRRVNDVPGSTEAQRRWHIDQILWTKP